MLHKKEVRSILDVSTSKEMLRLFITGSILIEEITVEEAEVLSRNSSFVLEDRLLVIEEYDPIVVWSYLTEGERILGIKMSFLYLGIETEVRIDTGRNFWSMLLQHINTTVKSQGLVCIHEDSPLSLSDKITLSLWLVGGIRSSKFGRIEYLFAEKGKDIMKMISFKAIPLTLSEQSNLILRSLEEGDDELFAYVESLYN